MAKRKRHAALFEVIHREPRHTPATRAPRTPLRWFNRRNSAAASGGATSLLDTADDPTLRPHPLLHNHQGLGMVEVGTDHPLPQPARPSAAVPSPVAPAVAIDRSRQVIRLRVTFTSAAVAGFALLVVVVLAYMLGRGIGRDVPASTVTVTSEQIQRGPATPTALEVARANEPQRVADQITVAARNPTPAPVPPPPAASVRGDRIVGMNYVIIQSYPEQEEAEQAAKLLQQYGIPCTVEKGTPYAPRWYSVVGLQPFDQLSSNPQYAAYVKQIETISQKFAGSSRFKRFEPKPFKWQKK